MFAYQPALEPRIQFHNSLKPDIQMKYSHLLLLCGVLLLAGYTRGTSQNAPKKASTGLDADLLKHHIIYPKAALKGGATGSVTLKWFPATQAEPAHVSIGTGSSEVLAEAVRRGLRAFDRKLIITETLDNTSNLARWYDVSFRIESVKGKRVGHIEVYAMISVATPEPSSPKPSAEEHYPDMDEFVQVDKEPVWDQTDLQRRIKYPELAQRNNIQGQVIIRALIGRDGHVVKTHIDRSDHPSLNDASIEAVTHTSFTPAMKDGKPIAVWVSIPITFKLSN
ncbi:MAG: energy transducer TonB [Candidatus Kapaibacterium sp.]